MAYTAGNMAAKNPAFSGRHAVVIGGSMAGLLAARVLADHFAQVTIVERDTLPDEATPRKGVPQGRQAHGLLDRGRSIMADLFPGIFEELIADGAHCLDVGRDLRWFQSGDWKVRFESGVMAYSFSRPLLEWKIRKRVAALPNVRFFSPCDVTALQLDPTSTAVTGVSIRHRDGSEAAEVLTAELVVEAGGRGSRMPAWLSELGFGQVPETEVKSEVGYATRIYRRPANPGVDWQAVMINPKPPLETRMGLILPLEGDRWIATVCGWHRDYPPADDAGFLEYARGLPQPDMYNALKDAEPLESVVTYKIPSNLRRNYEQMARFPEGLAVLGDALCSFNPIYGQGMTTSALDAVTLDTCLRAQAAGSLAGFADAFRKQVVKVIETPWMLATGEDFRYPQTEGKRPPGTRFLHWYTGHVQALTAHDTVVLHQFLKVMHMQLPPTALFAPAIVGRVLASLWRGKPSAATRSAQQSQPGTVSRPA